MAEMKRGIKDSVFTYLFRQPEYTLELYRTLHPEDTSTTEADLKLVTLENIISTGIYNDLGIQAGKMLILLMEAQSTFSINIVLRLFLYLAETYKEYVEEHKLDLYAGTAVQIPRPELYVVYTGVKIDVPEVLHLSDIYEGEGSVEISVRVLRDTGNCSILDQYIQFCKISDEQRKRFGYTQKAIDETIRLCLEQNILAPFLLSRQKEVTDIMVTLFSQEKVSEIHDFNLAKHSHEKGRVEGIEEGRTETRKEFIHLMLETMSPEQVAKTLKMSLEEVRRIMQTQNS